MIVEYPVRAFKENAVLLKNGQVWVYYRISSEHVSLVDDEKKEKMKRKVAHFFDDLKDYQHVDVFMISKDMTLEERFEEMEKYYFDETLEVSKEYAKKTIQLLKEEMGTVYVYDWIVGIPLSVLKEETSIKKSIQKEIEKVSVGIYNAFGYEVEVMEEWYEAYREVEKMVYSKMSVLNASRLTEKEMYYLNRLHFIRGMEHSLKIEYLNDSVDSLTDGIVDAVSRVGSIALKTYNGESVVAFLPLANTDISLNHIHLAEVLQQLPFPVELRYKVKYLELQGINGLTSRLNRSEDRLDVLIDERLEAGSMVGSKEQQSFFLTKDLRKQMEHNEVMVQWECVVVLVAKDYQELQRRIERFISYMKSRRLEFVRASFDQLKLFHQSFMGQTLEKSRNWQQYSTTKGLAENLLFSGSRVGTRSGFYIGRIDSRYEVAKNRESALLQSKNIVLFNMMIANKDIEGKRTDSPHIAITGETGKGKSYLMKYLWMLSTFSMKTLYFDPKQEIRYWFSKVLENEKMRQKAPLLMKHIETFNFVTLDVTNKENHGVLDPIVFLSSEEAKETAIDVVSQFFSFDGKERLYLAFLEELDNVIEGRKQGKTVGLMTVIERLQVYADEMICENAKLLKAMIYNSVLELVFSDGSKKGLDLKANTTVLEVRGLELPHYSDDSRYYSEKEKKSSALMLVIGMFCKKLGSEDRTQETAQYIDEAWIFKATKSGQRILKEMKRVGRAENNMLVFGTQLVGDVFNEEEHGNFGTLFAFDEPHERPEILRCLGLECNEATEKWLENTIKGQCIMLDVYRRIAKITVHCPFPEMDELFKTIDSNVDELETKFV